MSISAIVETSPVERGDLLLPKLGMVISAQFSASGFTKKWTHCNQLANFLARYASAGEPDPERQATLLSTFINEVLEVLYRHHHSGEVQLTFRRQGKRMGLRAEVPADADAERFYTGAVGIFTRPDLDAWYREWLERVPGLDDDAPRGGAEPGLDISAAGVLELVAVYDTVVKLEGSADGRTIVLSFDFPYGNEDME
jgi:hypothetical protein